MTTINPYDWEKNGELENMFMRIAEGRLPGVTYTTIFGVNQDVDILTTPEDITTIGGVYIPPTAASTMSIVSDSALDTFGTGTGAWVLQVDGLDANYEPISELVNMNGLTPVVTTQLFFRISDLTAVAGGSAFTSYGATPSNQGTITCTCVLDATVTANILPNYGRYLTSFSTVPAGTDGYLVTPQASLIRVGGASGNMAEFTFLVKPPGGGWVTWGRSSASVVGSSFVAARFEPYPSIPEKYDITTRVSYVTDNNSIVNASYNMVYIAHKSPRKEITNQ